MEISYQNILQMLQAQQKENKEILKLLHYQQQTLNQLKEELRQTKEEIEEFIKQNSNQSATLLEAIKENSKKLDSEIKEELAVIRHILLQSAKMLYHLAPKEEKAQKYYLHSLKTAIHFFEELDRTYFLKDSDETLDPKTVMRKFNEVYKQLSDIYNSKKNGFFEYEDSTLVTAKEIEEKLKALEDSVVEKTERNIEDAANQLGNQLARISRKHGEQLMDGMNKWGDAIMETGKNRFIRIVDLYKDIIREIRANGESGILSRLESMEDRLSREIDNSTRSFRNSW